MVQMREPLLGTRAEAHIETTPAEAAPKLIEVLFDDVARREAVFTIFDHQSALHALRRTGATDNPDLANVHALATAWWTRSSGAFHPSVQPLVDLWDTAERDNTLPNPDTLAATAERLQRDIPVSDLNLNAIAKGWIAQAALTTVTAHPSASGGWLNLGGDVVHRGQGHVVVGIEDPHRPYDNVDPLATIELAKEALATSGTARRWWTVGDVRYSKVLDPRTGWPVNHIASATVVAGDAATADVLATVATIVEPEEALALVAACDAHCLLVARDGAVISSTTRFTRG